MKFELTGIFKDFKDEDKGKYPLITFLFLYIGLEYILSEYFFPIIYNIIPYNYDYMIIFVLFRTVIPIILYIFLYGAVYKYRLQTLGFGGKKLIQQYLTGSVIGFLLFFICILFSILFGLGKVEFNMFPNFTWVLFLFGFIIQGMSEEVLCRGVIFLSVSKKFGIIAGIVVNSIIFSALHLGNSGIGFLALLNLFLFGVLMSVMFYYYQNMWIIGAVHSIWNFTQGNIFGVLVSGIRISLTTIFTSEFSENSILTGGEFGIEGGLICTLVVSLLTIILVYINSKGNIKENQK